MCDWYSSSLERIWLVAALKCQLTFSEGLAAALSPESWDLFFRSSSMCCSFCWVRAATWAWRARHCKRTDCGPGEPVLHVAGQETQGEGICPNSPAWTSHGFVGISAAIQYSTSSSHYLNSQLHFSFPAWSLAWFLIRSRNKEINVRVVMVEIVLITKM